MTKLRPCKSRITTSRSDPELTELVTSTQAKIERISLPRVEQWVGSADLASIRFFVWAIRGLSIAQVLVPDPEEIRRSITYFRDLVESATGEGHMHGTAKSD